MLQFDLQCSAIVLNLHPLRFNLVAFQRNLRQVLFFVLQQDRRPLVLIPEVLYQLLNSSQIVTSPLQARLLIASYTGQTLHFLLTLLDLLHLLFGVVL